MKYRLTQSAIEELKSMEFESSSNFGCAYEVADKIYDWYISSSDTKLLEPIAEKLPKPVLRSVEDLKALEGWEITWNKVCKYHPTKFFKEGDFEELINDEAKIRQIDMPENEYLVADCIEQEIEVGDIAKHEGGFIGLVQSIWGSYLVEVELGNRTDEYCYHLNDCKLIRKASEITQSDREKYLGEKVEEQDDKEQIYVQAINDYGTSQGVLNFEVKVREIIKKVLKEEAGE